MSILFTGVTKIFCGTQNQSVQSYGACTCQQAPEEASPKLAPKIFSVALKTLRTRFIFL